jgi:hypothetical protein
MEMMEVWAAAPKKALAVLASAAFPAHVEKSLLASRIFDYNPSYPTLLIDFPNFQLRDREKSATPSAMCGCRPSIPAGIEGRNRFA